MTHAKTKTPSSVTAMSNQLFCPIRFSSDFALPRRESMVEVSWWVEASMFEDDSSTWAVLEERASSA
eukprot:CAMPEP_0177727402 /NCGR_PEP_ID=MMETSP0484_2-20121128/20302_1 /TAXON_ID=354590 /ORGANISM="Rhodomonas lens, Strain RHODO" /LENGTH=66 /DNA_ID=CAMNT_0019240053 /DNA_START=181 /DNA_END=378 /DNA_ORIENTATION=-